MSNHEKSDLSALDTSHKTPSFTNESLFRVDACCERFCVHKSTWWRWVKTGFAPKGIRISRGITAWRKSELDAFMARLVADGSDQNVAS